MKGQLMIGKNHGYTRLLAASLLLLSLAALGQVPVDEDGNPLGTYAAQGIDDGKPALAGEPEATHFDATELEELVGPVALYPDDLLAIVLPASTYPLEIVQAARFLEQLEDDKSLEPDESWDESVVALLNYPDVVHMMDEDIDWTWRLGEAVITQQADVIAAVESFRDRAYAAGNLKSDQYQEVSQDEGIIEIVPVDDEIIYVPYYEPAEVIVRQPRTVYHYYPDPYPVYYYPYPAGYHFHSGFFWGVTTAFSIGWPNHYLHVYHPSYWGHPYYGSYYYGHYYRRPSITVYNNWYVTNNYRYSRNRYRDGDYWRPRHRAGSRPEAQRVRNYHYAPNGSAGSRDHTASRRDTLRTRSDGRMDLSLRDRGNAVPRSSRNSASRTADSRSSANARNDGNGLRQSRTATSQDRNSARRSAGNTADNTRASQQNRRDGQPASRQGNSRATFSFRERRAESSAAQSRLTSRSVTSSRDRQSALASSPVARAARPGRSSAPASQARPAVTTRSGSSAATIRQNRTAAPRATAPARSAPAPRASAPAARQSAPAPQRSNSRAADRGAAGAASSRRSSAGRTRRGNHD